jgi:curved DNA-binding protein CbpA
MHREKDYYAILGVLPTAEDVVIKGAYRALAQRYHPDRLSGDPLAANTHMTDINEAYLILSDPTLRAEYDKVLRIPFASSLSATPLIDATMTFEAEQYRDFAGKLHDWGYDRAAILEALVARGVRQPIAQYLADSFAETSGED